MGEKFFRQLGFLISKGKYVIFVKYLSLSTEVCILCIMIELWEKC
jgi:hypothetical protein